MATHDAAARAAWNAQLAAYDDAEWPRFGPDWQLRFQVQFLFPQVSPR